MLTLPALHALRLAGAQSLTVLGSPVNWSFLRTAHTAPRVRDFSSSEWLGLFAAGVACGPAAQSTLAHAHTAVVYLSGDTSRTEKALKEAGVKRVLVADPPAVALVPSPCPLPEGEGQNKSSHNIPGRLEGCATNPQGEGEKTVLHAARRLLDPLAHFLGPGHAAAALAIRTVADDVFLALDEAETVRALERLGYDAVPDGGFVAIHPGSGGKAKCWPPERFARLAVKLALQGFTPLVFFGPADENTKHEFEEHVPPGVSWECVGSKPLREVLALLSCARCYAGNDSGITHLAARACPTVALFGPTDARIWSPLGKGVRIMRAPGGEMERLRVGEVAEAVSGLAQERQ